MTGALVLAAHSAAAAGAGLITLGVDNPLISLIAPQVPAFQTRVITELMSLVSRYDAMVVGPGWGRGEDRLALLEEFWKTDLPLVLDADALSAWTALNPTPRKAPVVVTPHPGEFLRLNTGSTASVANATKLAHNRGVTVVLKSAVTWIIAPDGRRAVWDGYNPALGTGGSGDCLAGVVGALLARGLDGFEAASAAVALHGVAGKQLADSHGWFTGDKIPQALAKVASACMLEPRPL
jgi:NAD(P)H-hydrate epimerase